MPKMTLQTYRVTTADNADTDPAGWWACDTISAAAAAGNYVDAEEHDEDCKRAVFVLCPDGQRLRFTVAVTIERHLEARLED